jgi:hypothetical protein
MKVWFDKQDIKYNNFISEQFLLLPLFEQSVINQNRDFNNSKEWIDEISKIIVYVNNVQDSDVIVYPNKLDSGIKKYIDISLNTSKRLVCFYNDDNAQSSCLSNNTDIYRTSFNSSKRKETEHSMPAWSCDFTKLTSLNYRKKNKLPVVGFCGAITHKIRRDAVELLSQNNQIINNFKIRDSFWGGNIHNQYIRREFIDNMSQSDTILCCRGAGNFSFRLYESMSLGKIPIIVNTDIVLPCDDIIKWREVGIWVDDIRDINHLINQYWNNITEEEYLTRQKLNREIYERYLSPSGFTQYLSNKYTKI